MSDLTPPDRRATQAQEDSDAAVMARIEILDYLRRHGLLWPGMDERNREPHQLLDAYAAALRAPSPPEVEQIETMRDKLSLGYLQRRYGLNAANAMKLQDDLVHLLALRAPSPVTRDQVVAALQHITSRVDTERILGRLGFSEQEITDALR